jgi:hypothetical protein
MIVFKLQDRITGLFSSGSSVPMFSKKGKVWKQRGHLINHLRLWESCRKCKCPDSWAIIEYELIEKSTESVFDALLNNKKP